ncbi:ABC transporter substrate-binding protein [Caballeronia sp. LZ033]|uniref:ABC transporter substrate-binding protein n=1 Tax=Caballeronia sp. LZ033 TaxID=3038566 RepID=UPI002856E737|nr:ABC transporter substrate-binding protein [Caballeronia sp. LZ033]MDR5818694.1 ABC transporter substrate-binding protein [Caballeronia sp. LZ033]
MNLDRSTGTLRKWLSWILTLLALGTPWIVNAQSPIQTPAVIKSAGVLRIASYIGFPPLEFDKDGQMMGAEIDLGKALADKLGVKASFSNVPFEGIIPGLLSGRFDMALSDMSDTEARRKQVDFVDYAQAFTSIIVQKGNPRHIRSLGDLCGLPVATQQGSMQSTILEQQSSKCAADGKQPIAISRFPSQAQVSLDLKSGRSAAEVRDFALGVYEVDQSEGRLEVVSVDGKPAMVGESGKVGIAVKKGNLELAKAIQAALQSLKADGTYERIFDKWNVSAEKISDFTINDGQ